MQTEKSQPKGKQIMPKTTFTEFPALSVVLKVGISWSVSETNDFFFLPVFGKMEALKRIFTIRLYDCQLQTSFGIFRYGALRMFASN